MIGMIIFKSWKLVNRFFEYVIGLGLVLFPVNNYYLGMQYGIRIKDVALVLIICGSIGVLWKARNFGNKWHDHKVKFNLDELTGICNKNKLKLTEFYRVAGCDLVCKFVKMK